MRHPTDNQVAVGGIIAVLVVWLVIVASVAVSVGTPHATPSPVTVQQITNPYVEAVRIVESAGNQNAVSYAGAIGSMQVMPSTADDPGFGITPAKKHADGSYDLNDVDRVGAEYLQAMMDRYDNDFETALIAYNAGPGNADMWVLNGKDYSLLPDRAQTEAYVEKAYTNYFHLLAENVS